MSFWDPKYLEEQKKKREAEEKRRREMDMQAKKKRDAQLAAKKKKIKALKAKKRRELEEEEEESAKLGVEGEEKNEEPKAKEAFVPPVLNRGFGAGFGSPFTSQQAYNALKKNELEQQKKAAEDQQGGADSMAMDIPKLSRPF